MSRMLYGNIDLSKINKDKIYEGKKGKYLPVVIWIDETEDKFGNIASVQEGQTKEERESGVPKNYLGNLKRPPEKNQSNFDQEPWGKYYNHDK